jgi:hypothetical protein
MSPLLPRFVKVAYRKEPISSFILIVGAVDVVIGGMGEKWSLLSIGLATAGSAVVAIPKIGSDRGGTTS